VRFSWLNIGVCLVLAVAPAGVLTLPGHAVPGDANGDRRVDILDLQQVIAAVLGGSSDPRADVNGDGRVDIRDYQCLVECANGIDAEPAPVPDPLSATVVPAFRAAPRLGPESRAGALLPMLARESVLPCIHASARAGVESRAGRVRYVLCLTPHAPPACG
jgi:hypothetical protein